MQLLHFFWLFWIFCTVCRFLTCKIRRKLWDTCLNVNYHLFSYAYLAWHHNDIFYCLKFFVSVDELSLYSTPFTFFFLVISLLSLNPSNICKYKTIKILYSSHFMVLLKKSDFEISLNFKIFMKYFCFYRSSILNQFLISSSYNQV